MGKNFTSDADRKILQNGRTEFYDLTQWRHGNTTYMITDMIYQAILGLALTTAEQTVDTVNVTSVEANAILVVHLSVDVNITVGGAGNADVRLYVDGVLQSPRIFVGCATTGRWTGSKVWQTTLSSTGSHTLDIKALKSNAAPTITLQGTHSVIHATVWE